MFNLLCGWLFPVFFLLHIPRILIEIKSRLHIFKNCIHGEDSYQKSRNITNNTEKRILSWSYFDMTNEEWEEYIDNIVPKLLYLYKSFFCEMLKNVKGDELVCLKPHSDVISYKLCGDVVVTWIDMKNQIIRTCFNHQWCSGHFFIQYATIIFKGENINLINYPRTPFLIEYSLIKMLVYKPHKPISRCFNVNISQEEIKRIKYEMKIDYKLKDIHKRTIILWNIMTLLNTIHRKDYNILIPVPFAPIKNIWNNIGAVFIKWPKEGLTLEELEKNIKLNSYNAIASNIYLRACTSSNIGKEIRNNVDIVFSSAYVKNPKILPKYNAMTFSDVADYGIYCLTTTIKDITNVSLTFSTNDFNFKNLLSQLEKMKIDYMLI